MKFEYKTVQKGKKGLSEEELNKLGKQKWELVSHTIIWNNTDCIQGYIFKRSNLHL